MIQEEDPYKPLSDNAISKKLDADDIKLARRTVAKYRVQFGIGNASQRRNYA